MKGVFNILDRTGDTTLEWSTEQAEQNEKVKDPEWVKSEFDRLVTGGHLAFSTDAEGVSEQIKQFDPKVHTKVTISPQFVGG